MNQRCHLGPTKERIRLDDVLAHGMRMAGEEYESPNLSAAVWCLLQEAMRTWRAMPDRERAILGEPKSNMPEPSPPTYWERFELELDRIATGMPKYDTQEPRKPRPSPAAIDRAEMVLGWMRGVRTRHTRRDVAMTLDLAAGVPVRIIRIRFPMSRQAVYKQRDFVVWQIVCGLSVQKLAKVG